MKTMIIRLNSGFTHFVNCVIFELISGQLNEVLSQTTELDLTANQLVTNTDNSSLVLDFLQNNEITIKTVANSSVNICDEIDCNKNRLFCQINHCSSMNGFKRTHFIITGAIIFVVMVLMLIAMYACHKESKRSNRWNRSRNRFEEYLMAIRIVQSLDHNQHNHEMVPMRRHNQSPPPYEYNPPPPYEETVQQSNQ